MRGAGRRRRTRMPARMPERMPGGMRVMMGEGTMDLPRVTMEELPATSTATATATETVMMVE